MISDRNSSDIGSVLEKNFTGRGEPVTSNLIPVDYPALAGLEELIDRSASLPDLSRLVVVSNRLPVALHQNDTGSWRVEPAAGGLVTALTPILRRRKGLWIGWLGLAREINLDNQLTRIEAQLGCSIEPVRLNQEDVDQYYLGFSNETLWPLFHDLLPLCKFETQSWHRYQMVNHKFAREIVANCTEDDYIWVHDYQLLLLARELHRLGLPSRAGFFLHIPFPSPDIFRRLPWHHQILKALLEYDLIGFQTIRDRNNFLHCCEACAKIRYTENRDSLSVVDLPGRKVMAGVFPISIDFDEFSRGAADSSVTGRVKHLRYANPDCRIILGVDRLDYSKGILLKLKAFHDLLDRFPELRGKVTLIQLTVPSRENIPAYRRLKEQIEALISEINGRFAQPGWTPVQYIFHCVTRPELLAYYRAADVALITSLKDGMNLVAKEYCAANIDNDGVLVLSEFTGAAAQLGKYALLVNPYNIDGLVVTIYNALNMTVGERKLRMNKMRKSIRKRDIYWWADSFLKSAKHNQA